ncbi:MAG: amino acid--tRNA ligase-related protein [Candidatus Anstonellales archaeon]
MLGQLVETKNRFEIINSEEMACIDRINSSLYTGAVEYFIKNGFCWVEVPTLTKITGACENVNTLYTVDHFGVEAYLAQTGQLYLEAKIPSHKKVWTVITSSRAEQEVDGRHLNQFTLLEFEHIGDFESLLFHIEELVKNMIRNALKNNEEDFNSLGVDAGYVFEYTKKFNRITYTEAIEILKPDFNINWGDDLKSKHELFLVDALGGRPLFITHYPKEIKFFNMRVNEEDDRIVNSADLIMPFSGESVGSAERENNYERLVERLLNSPMYRILKERGKSIDDFADYLNLIKKDPILHSGCGIGFNRISQSVLQVNDIRIVTNYPLNRENIY